MFEDLGRMIGESAVSNALSFVDAGVLPERETARAAEARSEYVAKAREGDTQAAIPPLRTLVHLREGADAKAKAERSPARGPSAPDLPYFDKQDQAEDQAEALKQGPAREEHLATVKTRSDLSATFVNQPLVILAKHTGDAEPARELGEARSPRRAGRGRQSAPPPATTTGGGSGQDRETSLSTSQLDRDLSAAPTTLPGAAAAAGLSESEQRRAERLRPAFSRPARDRADPIAEPLAASGVATALTLERALRKSGVSEAEIDAAVAAATPLLRRRIEEALELEADLSRAEREALVLEIQRGRAGIPQRGPMAGASPAQLITRDVLRSHIVHQLREIRRLDPSFREPASVWPVARTPSQAIRYAKIRLTNLQNARWQREAAALAAQFRHLGSRGETIAGNITAGVRNPYFIGRYRDLLVLRDRGAFRFPVEIHHLNQTGMMGGRIPPREGLGVTALGNPTRGAPAQHMGVHRYLEENLFRRYRPGGGKSGQTPTFSSYNSATENAYRAAGFPSVAIRRIMEAQRREQRAYGFRETDPLSRLPGPVRVPRRFE